MMTPYKIIKARHVSKKHTHSKPSNPIKCDILGIIYNNDKVNQTENKLSFIHIKLFSYLYKTRWLLIKPRMLAYLIL